SSDVCSSDLLPAAAWSGKPAWCRRRWRACPSGQHAARAGRVQPGVHGRQPVLHRLDGPHRAVARPRGGGARWPRHCPAATMRAGEGVAPPTEVEMKMSIARRFGAVALLLPLLLPLALNAQSLPKPEEFYFDGDGSTTRPLVLLEGSDAATQERLVRAM